MTAYRNETAGWVSQAQVGTPPYASKYNHGMLIVTVIKVQEPDGLVISDQVRQRGMAWWRAVNETVRARRIHINVDLEERRVEWHAGDRKVVNGRVTIQSRLERTVPGAQMYAERDWSVQFEARSIGAESVLSRCSPDNCCLESRFVVLETEDHVAQRDWIGAAAEMVKQLPGGAIVLSPLIKLRDDERRQAQNAKIEALIGSNQSVSEDVLRRTIDLEGSVSEIKAISSLLAPMIDELVRSDRERRPSKKAREIANATPALSQFPVPLTEGVLIEELQILFPHKDNLGELVESIETCNYKKPEAERAFDFISQFVKSLRGQAPDKVKCVFEKLHAKKPGSAVIGFAAEYLAAGR